jgi:aminoglycoside phosphotransferase (APT) family kinase protein
MDDDVATLVDRLGLSDGGILSVVPLAGGVSSDIVKVATRRRTFVLKRALARLKVAADWRAPVERNSYEVEWLRVAAAIAPHAVPLVLASDAEAGTFAMAWLDPAQYRVWKTVLRDGEVDLAFAGEVGARIGRIHAATAGSSDVAARFATDAIFQPIRLEPYLEATAVRHPQLADRLIALSRATLATHIALVHGDVSPKNILVGPDGPVFLDAECAWYGDPSFDLAFCLNHLLLKCLWNRPATDAYLAGFDALYGGYMAAVRWEPPPELERSAAALLPALLLARIDGKSPVEYVTDERDRDLVRRVAVPLIVAPPERLVSVRDAWVAALRERKERR